MTALAVGSFAFLAAAWVGFRAWHAGHDALIRMDERLARERKERLNDFLGYDPDL